MGSAIAEELSKSDIVIVLISSHFFNSVYCVERELTRARERKKERGIVRFSPRPG
jgi:hypothetical protein